MRLDCFIRNTTQEEMDELYEEFIEYFIAQPVPLWIDNGTEGAPDIELLGFHVKVLPGFYKAARAVHSTKINLYQSLPQKFKKDKKFPMHVFGSGGSIETASDTDDLDTFCDIHINKDYGLSKSSDKAFKIDKYKLVEMTQEEKDEKGIKDKTEETDEL